MKARLKIIIRPKNNREKLACVLAINAIKRIIIFLNSGTPY